MESEQSNRPEISGVNVVCRFRPLNESEEKSALEGDGPPFACLPQGWVEDRRKGRVFNQFDTLFDASATQRKVYESTARQMVDMVLDGYNAGMFAYGQSGGGKTYSMMGKEGELTGDLRGIVPRAMSDLFYAANRMTEESRGGMEVKLCISFMEIYKDEVYDLLHQTDGNNVKLKGREDRHLATLKEYTVENEVEANKVVTVGQERRRYAFMPLNPVSSRSHGVLMLKIKQRFPDTSVQTSALYFVDLMGSEALVQDNAASFDETTTINMDLLTLGKIIQMLGKNTAKNVQPPYRDSTLTWILRDVLGGNTRATVLVTCSPHQMQYNATQNTLEFGDQCKGIQRRIERVEKKLNNHELQRLVQQLRDELASARLEAANAGPSEATEELIAQLTRDKDEMSSRLQEAEHKAQDHQSHNDAKQKELEKSVAEAKVSLSAIESKLANQILQTEALKEENRTLKSAVAESQGDEVLEAIKGKLEKGLAASLTESQREGLASGEGGTFAALVEELIEDKEAMALKLSHAEQQLARVQGELETKQQILSAMAVKRDSDKEAHDRAGVRWMKNMEEKEKQLANCKEHIAELRSQLSAEQARARDERSALREAMMAAQHDAETAEDRCELIASTPRGRSNASLDDDSGDVLGEPLDLASEMKKRQERNQEEKLMLKERLNEAKRELAEARALEEQLDSELCATREQVKQLSKDLEESAEVEKDLRREKCDVEEELNTLSDEKKVFTAEHETLVKQLEDKNIDLNQRLDSALQENHSLKEDKRVADSARKRSNQSSARAKFAQTAMNVSRLTDTSEPNTPLTPAVRLGATDLSRGRADSLSLSPQGPEGKKTLAHMARHNSHITPGEND